MRLYSGGLIIGRTFASEIWGAYIREGFFFFWGGGGGGAYYRNFTGILNSEILNGEGRFYFAIAPKGGGSTREAII